MFLLQDIQVVWFEIPTALVRVVVDPVVSGGVVLHRTLRCQPRLLPFVAAGYD